LAARISFAPVAGGISAFGAKATLTPRYFDDDLGMRFNRRKMEDRRRQAPEQEAAARRALREAVGAFAHPTDIDRSLF
jgi:hypothetical protein